jgi:hypothetical protein
MPSKAKPAPVSAAASFTLERLTVRSIHVSDDIQPREDLNDMVVEEYATLYREAEDDGPLPALDVFVIGGKHYVSDGFHRLEAAKRAKRKDLACHVYAGSQQEAMRHGVFANLKRGLAYSPHDRERILERLLQDPVVNHRSDRSLARDLNLSHVTVGRARHRLAVEASLEEEWRAVQVTQTQDEPRRLEQIATFLEVEPAVVASYEKIRQRPLDQDRVIAWVARNMTDRNEPEADAKAGVRTNLQREVRNREQERAHRRQARGLPPAKETPEERTRREAGHARREEEYRRSRRDQHVRHTVERFAELHDGMRDPWGEAHTFADLMAALSPETWKMLPDLLSQAEAVIQTLRDAIASSLAPATEA